MTPANLEVPVDSAAGLAAAIKGGAARIELCSALALGGLTPSAGLIGLAKKSNTPVRAMIRPRGGGFHYSDDEISQMLDDIDTARNAGLDGIVVGATTAAGLLDQALLKKFRDRAGNLRATLHRVVDTLADPVGGIDIARQSGFDTVLSSGGQRQAEHGCDILRQMVERANGEVTVMAGSGVNSSNQSHIRRATGVTWLHASCATTSVSPANLSEFGFAQPTTAQTDPEKIAEFVQVLAQPA